MAAFLNEDELFMKRAFDLAVKGLGFVSPNPMVGAVVVFENKIIGEGYHQQFGKAHAEVNAIESVIDKDLLSKSTLYVNLEPCSHFGKTPPCADLIIKNKIPKVVISNIDPNPLVTGKGIKLLKNAGVEVVIGVLEQMGEVLNKRFFTNIQSKRTYVILKWAQTADGFIAKENFDSKWISGLFARKLVHKWRSEEDGILVGFNTAKYDNPLLNVRDWNGRNPNRIVFDKNLNLSKENHIFNSEAKTFIVNNLVEKNEGNLNFIKIENIENLNIILERLLKEQIGSIIVEGGSNTINQFIKSNLWDEARVFISNTKKFNNGIKAPKLDVPVFDFSSFGEDTLYNYQNLNSK